MKTELEPKKEYAHILSLAAQLDRQTQMELLVDLAAQVRAIEGPKQKKPSIMELQGIFKGAWGGQDAQDYVNQERDAWNG